MMLDGRWTYPGSPFSRGPVPDGHLHTGVRHNVGVALATPLQHWQRDLGLQVLAQGDVRVRPVLQRHSSHRGELSMLRRGKVYRPYLRGPCPQGV